MIFKTIFLILVGRGEDALAPLTRKHFIDQMKIIEGFEPISQELIAEGFVALMTRFGELARSSLPEHCHQNYMIFLDPEELRREAANFYSQAKANSVISDPMRTILSNSQWLVGFYLFSRSWKSKSVPKSTARHPYVDLNCPPMVQERIKHDITQFLVKHNFAWPN